MLFLPPLLLPRRVVALLEGKSLVNDASGLVLYRFAVAAVLTDTFSLAQEELSFGALTIGGVLAGTAFGYAASWLLGRRRDTHLAILGSFLAA